MEKTNKVIFAFPRSGTKLLASIYAKRGYHNLGEYFNTYTCKVIDHPVLRAVRMSSDDWTTVISKRIKNHFEYNNLLNNSDILNRIDQLQKFDTTMPNIFTMWLPALHVAPQIYEIMLRREILCLRRNNIFEQLLSRFIALENYNYGETDRQSLPIKIKVDQFTTAFYVIHRTNRLQDDLVKRGHARFIDYDRLIAGNESLGFSYTVDSKDEHDNLERYVTNIDEIKNLYKKLEKTIDF